jgi:hypothetical protein
VACEALFDGQGEALTQKAIALALKGNIVALKLCLDRICPVRGARLMIDVPEIKQPADVVTAISAVLRAVNSGVLSCEEAAALASIVNYQKAALELVELEARVSALEAVGAQRGGTQ